MISVMLVAGKTTTSLRSFLEAPGSLKVTSSFNTLMQHSEELSNGIFDIDKLVYVYSDADMTVRQDMSLLNQLLSDTYFNVGEILFYIAEGEVPPEGLNFFMESMRQLENLSTKRPSIIVPSQTIVRTQGLPTFDQLYRSILGLDKNQTNRENKYKSVYIEERGNDSRKSYEPVDSTTLNPIEPFSYNRVTSYINTQKVADVNDTGRFIYDETNGWSPEKVSVDLGELRISSLPTPPVVGVVTGNNKSGITTFCAALAVSSLAAKKKVLMLDLTKNKGLTYLLKQITLPVHDWSLADFLLNSTTKQDLGVGLIHNFVYNVRIQVLRNVLDNISRFKCDVFIIDCDKEDFAEISSLFNYLKANFFILSTPYVPDIENILPLFSNVLKADLILSGLVPYYDDLPPLTPEDLKSRIWNLRRLASPIKIDTFDINENFAGTMLGVK